MSENPVQTNVRANQTAYLNGEKVTIVSSSLDFVVVEDDQGNKVTISRDKLSSTPILCYNDNFVDPEVVERFDKRISQYEVLYKETKETLKSAREKLQSFMSKCGVTLPSSIKDSESKEMYKELKSEFYEANSSKVAASCRLRSTLVDKFIYIT